MFLIITKYLIHRSCCGLATLSFIFIRYPANIRDLIVLNHEKNILVPAVGIAITKVFYLVYAWVTMRLLEYINMGFADKNIIFDREARAYGFNKEYLENGYI